MCAFVAILGPPSDPLGLAWLGAMGGIAPIASLPYRRGESMLSVVARMGRTGIPK